MEASNKKTEKPDVAIDDVIIMDTPEKWLPCKDIECEVAVNTPMNTTIKFAVRPLTCGKQVEFIERFRFKGKFDYENKEHEKVLMKLLRLHRAVLIDHCWKEIPGGTPEAKAQWIDKNIARAGDIDALEEQIMQASGRVKSVPGAQWTETKEMVTFKDSIVPSPEQWAEHSQTRIILCMKVRGKTLKFPVVPVPPQTTLELNVATEPGPPPKTAKKQGGKVVGWDENTEAPAYRDKLARKLAERWARFIEAGLGWDIPGKTSEQKVAWLRERPAEEVKALYEFITVDLAGVRDFTDGYSLQS
jgi:hypothetical protein